jgi:hypothetical protein
MPIIGNPVTQSAFIADTFNGGQTVYSMSVAPANTAGVIVAVHGLVQDPSTYAVNGNTLTFTAAPPSGTGNVSARYLGVPASGVVTTAYRTVTDFTATSGQTIFTPPSYTSGFIDVYRNGIKLGAADYTATNGTTVTLTTASVAGDLVEIVSFYVSSVLNAIPAQAGAVGSTYLASNLNLINPSLSGQTLINASNPIKSYSVASIAFNGQTQNGFDIQNTSSSYAGTLGFWNSTGSNIGYLTMGQTGVTLNVGTNGGVTFNNSSAVSSGNTLNDYETGTWTPTDVSGAGLSYTLGATSYTKIGNMVYASCVITFPSNSNGLANAFSLPFSAASYVNNLFGGVVGYTNYGSGLVLLGNGISSMSVYNTAGTQLTNASLSGLQIRPVFFYKASF